MSIPDSLEKINPVRDREGSQRPSVPNGVKQFLESDKGKDILIVGIVILVGLGSFELGRLSKGSGSSGIKIEYDGEVAGVQASAISGVNNSDILENTKTEKNSSGKNFFASSRGTKYYPVGCAGGKNIKIENRIYFATKEDAERAGYGLSSSCR